MTAMLDTTLTGVPEDVARLVASYTRDLAEESRRTRAQAEQFHVRRRAERATRLADCLHANRPQAEPYLRWVLATPAELDRLTSWVTTGFWDGPGHLELWDAARKLWARRDGRRQRDATAARRDARIERASIGGRVPGRIKRAIADSAPCVYCGGVVDPMTSDHIISVYGGGWDWESNLVPCCISCNSSKGTQPPWEWSYYRTLDACDRDPKVLMAVTLHLFGVHRPTPDELIASAAAKTLTQGGDDE